MRMYMLQHLSSMEGALSKRTDAALIDLSERIIRGGFAIAFGCGILIDLERYGILQMLTMSRTYRALT